MHYYTKPSWAMSSIIPYLSDYTHTHTQAFQCDGWRDAAAMQQPGGMAGSLVGMVNYSVIYFFVYKKMPVVSRLFLPRTLTHNTYTQHTHPPLQAVINLPLWWLTLLLHTFFGGVRHSERRGGGGAGKLAEQKGHTVLTRVQTHKTF